MTITRFALVAICLVTAATIVQSSRVHGFVYDDKGTPLVNAVVWIADADSVQVRLRTDAQGRFHAWHRPFAFQKGAMLLCAPGHSTMVTSEIVRAWVAEFGLGAWPVNAPHPPKPAPTWPHAAPAECARQRFRGPRSA